MSRRASQSKKEILEHPATINGCQIHSFPRKRDRRRRNGVGSFFFFFLSNKGKSVVADKSEFLEYQIDA